MKQLLIKIWHYMPMLLILIMSSATYISVQSYLYDNSTAKNKFILNHEPIYKMHNAEFTDLSLNNSNKYRIIAAQAIQFADDKSFSLDNIQIYNSDDKQTINIDAKSGTIDGEFNVINFNTALVKHQNKDSQTTISSDNMMFYPKLDKVETKSHTIIAKQQNNIKDLLEADNIIFNNITRNLQLNGKIFGIINVKN